MKGSSLKALNLKYIKLMSAHQFNNLKLFISLFSSAELKLWLRVIFQKLKNKELEVFEYISKKD